MTAAEQSAHLTERIEKLNERIEKLDLELAALRPEVKGLAGTFKLALGFASGLFVALIGLIIAGLLQAGAIWANQRNHDVSLQGINSIVQQHTASLGDLKDALDKHGSKIDEKLNNIEKTLDAMRRRQPPNQ
jgi:hypothetical protein